MLCATINGPLFSQAQLQIQEALPHVDCIELCIHNLLALSIEELRTLMAMSPQTILTLYLPSQWSMDAWVNKTLQLAQLRPPFLTIDTTFPSSALHTIRNLYPDIKIIYAFHSDTAENIIEQYHKMSQTPAHFYKIVVPPTDTLQALQHMLSKQQLPSNVSILGSEKFGSYSRILSPIMNNPLNYTYGSQAQPPAPGQLSIHELHMYNYDQLSSNGGIFALIGEYTDRSISHLANNALFRAYQLPYCHLKCSLKKHEIKEFLAIAKQLPFQGLSVTAPFKKEVLQYVDHIDPLAQSCQSTNTLTFNNKEIIAHNTDGEGLAKLLEHKRIPIHGQKVAVLGAGGAAYAICHSLAIRGAHLTIFNRSIDKANHLANFCDGQAFSLESFATQSSFDLIISCLVPGVPIPPSFAPTIVDINTLPKESNYTKQAKQQGCSIIYGYEMFAEQGILQFHIWFPNRFDLQMEEFFREKVKNIMYSL